MLGRMLTAQKRPVLNVNTIVPTLCRFRLEAPMSPALFFTSVASAPISGEKDNKLYFY